MFKQLYKDYPQASQLHSTAAKKVCYPFIRLNQTVNEIVYRNWWMALFPFLDTSSMPWEISRLCTETPNHEENAPGGVGGAFQNGQEKKNSRSCEALCLKCRNAQCPGIASWCLHSVVILWVSTLLHFSVVLSVFNIIFISFTHINVIDLELHPPAEQFPPFLPCASKCWDTN